MLVKFALELDAIDGNVRSEDLNILTKSWGNFGILVHPTPKDGAKIVNVSKNWDSLTLGSVGLRCGVQSERAIHRFDFNRLVKTLLIGKKSNLMTIWLNIAANSRWHYWRKLALMSWA